MQRGRKRIRYTRISKTFGTLLSLVLLILITAFLFVYITQHNDGNGLTVPSGQSSGTDLPAESSQAAPGGSAGPSGSASSKPVQLSDWRLVLVNYDHKVPDDYQMNIVSAFGVDMDERIVEIYEKMYADAQKDNISLWISSAYRSQDKQAELFQREIRQNLDKGLNSSQAEATAANAVNRPGYSEHNIGLALDFNGVTSDFQNDDAYFWLLEHAGEYGFILRYPKEKEDVTKIMFEPWHFRYVGPEHAKKMNELGMCLEEYVEYLKNNP